MRDFDKEFERMRRRSNRMAGFALAWIGFVAVLMLTAIGTVVYLGATSSPEDVGAFVGRIVHGFKETQ